MDSEPGFLTALAGDGRPLLITTAGILIASGAFAVFQAATGQLLPHDAAYLGMTASELCALQDCRILHFMIHDRISFGGVLVAIGVVYLWLSAFPLRLRQAWSWWALAASGVAGFLSFLAYLGYGYFDTWHGVATLVLLPFFVAGLVMSRDLRSERLSPPPIELHSTAGIGRAMLILATFGIIGAGLTIMTVGMTTVFVPQDLTFMGMTRDGFDGINAHLVPLIAHDRAGFGGALVSCGVAMLACVRWAQPSAALWQALALAGAAGFGTAIGIHPIIGYTSATHLGPAVFGALVFAAGLGLTAVGRR